MPAMLTGRYPAKEVAPHYAAYPDNLFTLLGGLYDTDVQESITELCPPSECGDGVERERRAAGAAARGGRTVPADRLAARRAGQRPGGVVPRARRWPRRAPAWRAGDPKFRWDSLDDNQPSRFTTFLDGLTPTAAARRCTSCTC